MARVGNVALTILIVLLTSPLFQANLVVDVDSNNIEIINHDANIMRSISIAPNGTCTGLTKQSTVMYVTDLYQMAMPGSSSSTFMSMIRQSLDFSPSELKLITHTHQPTHWDLSSPPFEGKACQISGIYTYMYSPLF